MEAIGYHKSYRDMLDASESGIAEEAPLREVPFHSLSFRQSLSSLVEDRGIFLLPLFGKEGGGEIFYENKIPPQLPLPKGGGHHSAKRLSLR